MARSQEKGSDRGDESRQGNQGNSPTNLDDRSVDELRQMAGDLNIDNRDGLDRDQLIKEIQREREDDRMRRGGPDGGDARTGFEGADREQGGRQQGDGGQGDRQQTERGQSERQQSEPGQGERKRQ